MQTAQQPYEGRILVISTLYTTLGKSVPTYVDIDQYIGSTQSQSKPQQVRFFVLFCVFVLEIDKLILNLYTSEKAHVL